MSQLNLFNKKEIISVKKSEELRCCKTCNVEQPITNYSPVSGLRYRHWICKSCKREENKIREGLRKKIPQPDKDHKCPICLRDEKELKHLGGRNKTVWSLDHDWVTKEFRGWLCHKCNRALGNLHDDKDALARAIEYLNG